MSETKKNPTSAPETENKPMDNGDIFEVFNLTVLAFILLASLPLPFLMTHEGNKEVYLHADSVYEETYTDLSSVSDKSDNDFIDGGTKSLEREASSRGGLIENPVTILQERNAPLFSSTSMQHHAGFMESTMSECLNGIVGLTPVSPDWSVYGSEVSWDVLPFFREFFGENNEFKMLSKKDDIVYLSVPSNQDHYTRAYHGAGTNAHPIAVNGKCFALYTVMSKIARRRIDKENSLKDAHAAPSHASHQDIAAGQASFESSDAVKR